jgi:hypothetical protein
MSKEIDVAGVIEFFASFVVQSKPDWVVKYCADKGRLKFLESVIKNNPAAAVQYAKQVIGGRWEEAEDVIAEDFHFAVKYAVEVVKGRFSKLEKRIQTSRELALEYSAKIGQRFPDAEKAIAKGTFEEIFSYMRACLPGRFEAAEEKIIKSPKWMLRYADVLGKRLPEEMHSAMAMLSFNRPEDKNIKQYFSRYGK